MGLLGRIFRRKRKDEEQNDESFWRKAMIQFRKNKLAVWSWRLLKFLIIIALLADVLANDKPLACSYNDTTYFPVFKEYAVDLGMSTWPEELQHVDWHELEYDWVVRAPIPYNPNFSDKKNDLYVGPFDTQDVKSTYWRHWLGTDKLGHDVLASLIHGARISLLVGLVSMAIASLIGILLGALAGYFGDDRLRVSRVRLWLNLLFLFFACFYAFGSRGYILGDSFEDGVGMFMWEFLLSLLLFVGIMAIPNLLAIPLKRIPFLKKKVAVPVDIIVMRMIEIMLSIPSIFLILALVAILEKPSLLMVMVIIGFTRWTGIARLIRGELLRIRNLEYVEAAQALGFSEFRTIVRHAIPNALSPVLIAIAFGVAAAILIEAFLSFIGISPAEMTWGKLLTVARDNVSAWWLAIFPGLAIFYTVTVLNLVGEGLTDAMDPRLRK